MGILDCALQSCGGVCVCNYCVNDTTGLSMTTVNPNPSQSQDVSGGCGGASCLANTLNAVGKWGTALTGILQGKPVATSKTGVAVGAKGSTGLSGGMSGGGILFILVLVAVVFFLVKKG